MDRATAINAIEQRAFDARIFMKDVCEQAGVNAAVWSRAKTSKRISVRTLAKMEAALTAIEKERADG